MVPVSQVRVWVIAEDPWARAGLTALLSSQEGLEVLGQSSSQVEAPADPPDAIVWDFGAEGRKNLETLSSLSEAGTPVLALLDDETEAAQIISAGARGVLFREDEPETLSAAVRALAQGLMVLEPRLSTLIAAPDGEPQPLSEALTPRELQVLHRLSEGLSNKQIAKRLEVSEHTAKFHVASILSKLGVESRTEAVVRAAQLGLILL